MDEAEFYQQDNQLEISRMSKSQLAHLRESPAARERRLARNAERMREKRAQESFDEYRKRLEKNALNNRLKRYGESDNEKAVRHVRDAARQRLRRAMETPQQRADRLQKLAERMRFVRRNESPEKKADRLAKAAQAARERLQRETSEERRVRLHKSSQYARRMRSSKSKSSSYDETDSSLTSDIQDQKSSLTCEVDNGYFQQQLIIIPCRPERLVNNHYLDNFSMPTSYDSNHQMINDMQPSSSNLFSNNVTLNIPQYHTMMSVNNPMHDSLRKIKVETNTASMISYQEDVEGRSRGRPRKRENDSMQIKLETGKPSIKRRTDESERDRIERLRATAAKSRLRRSSETPEQRAKRLNDLKERARKRREEVKCHETEAEKKLRLARQADYARNRRLKLNTFEGKESVEKKARELYAKLNEEKPSVLEILEPIIEMNTSLT